VLAAKGGRVGGEKRAAILLNMNPFTLRTKMRKLEIPFGNKRFRFKVKDSRKND
jgi:hypothetical protein